MAQPDTNSQISALRSDVARLQKLLSAQTADAYHEIRDRADDAVKSAMPSVKSAARYVKSEGTAVAETAREHPAGLSTVVIASGLLGVALGYLLGSIQEQAPRRRYWL